MQRNGALKIASSGATYAFEASFGEGRSWRVAPDRSDGNGSKRVGFDPFAKPSANARFLRTADIAECGNRQAVLRPIARRCRCCCPQPCRSPGKPFMKRR